MAWRIAYTQFDGKTIGFHIVDTKGSTLPVVESGNGWETPEQLEKHARLIAAAPDLLDALKKLHESAWEKGCSALLSEELKAARAAIAEAEWIEPEEHTGEPDPTDLARDYNEAIEYGDEPTPYDP
jgi:Iap family predicted aminopeptidase